MKVYNDMCELLEKELGQMVNKGDITPTELESAYKSIDIIKDIETIKAMRNEYGHSSNNSYNLVFPYFNSNNLENSSDIDFNTPKTSPVLQVAPTLLAT
jgi:hypothetical protein